ncbi:MAG: dioxygenase [Bryobacteraceae bacterium]|jgi:catechol 1,2-dioxygenase
MKTADDITADVLRSFEATPDPRLKRIMQSLTRHLHAFVRDVELTGPEWYQAIEFLTRTGQKCSDKRQEFILLSDVMGISMMVDLVAHARPDGATESTVFGPFHREGAPELPARGNIAHLDRDGVPVLVSGRVLSLGGQPIEGAVLDVWQTASNGLYDSQDADLHELHMRGKFRTDARGGYEFRTTRPVHYQIPSDGPVGGMLRATGRHAWRPAHIHFAVSADGYEPVITHIFDSTDPYLKSDAVFAVKNSLIREFQRDDSGLKVDFDFVLAPQP